MAHQEPEGKNPQRALFVALLGVMVVGLILRCIGLGHLPGINGDESWSGFQAWQILHGESITFRTASGLPVNPLYMGVALVAHATGGVGSTVLRTPPLVFGALTVLLAVPLFVREIGLRAAVVLGALLAATPILIAYSRLSWDASATPFASLLCLWAALRGDLRWILVFLLLAVWVHPTNVFLAPMVLAPRAAAVDRDIRRPAVRRGALMVVGAGGVLFVACFPALVTNLDLPGPLEKLAFAPVLLQAYEARLGTPLGLLHYLGLFSDLISGVTIYTFITGLVSDPSRALHQIGMVLVLVPLWSLGILATWRARDERVLALAFAFLAMLPLAYLFAGPRMLTPHWERYSMFWVVPTCLLSAVFVDRLAARGGWTSCIARSGVIAVCVVQLGSFAFHYFGGLTAAESHSHVAFRTGPEDPKVAALERIDRLRDRRRPTFVYTGSVWSYWPMRYQAADRSGIHLTIALLPWDERFPADYRFPEEGLPADAEVFAVGLVGEVFDALLTQQQAQPLEEVRGYARDPILRIYRIEGAALLAARAWESIGPSMGEAENLAGLAPAALRHVTSVEVLHLSCNLGHQRALAIGLAHTAVERDVDAVLVMDSGLGYASVLVVWKRSG